jgi:hypothetical protein
VNVAALAYGVAAIVNICWPRTPDAPWYDNYLVLLSGLLVVLVGAAYLVGSRPHERSTGPYADAIPARATTQERSR